MTSLPLPTDPTTLRPPAPSLFAGVFEMRVYRHAVTGVEAIAMVARVRHGRYKGPVSPLLSQVDAGVRASTVPTSTGARAVVMRVHDQCQTSEIFGSVKCDCKRQLDHALLHVQTLARWAYQERLAALRAAGISGTSTGAPSPTTVSGSGGGGSGGLAGAASSASPTSSLPDSSSTCSLVDLGGAAPGETVAARAALSSVPGLLDDVVGMVIYLQQEGRGIGLAAKVSAYALQERADGVLEGFDMEEGEDDGLALSLTSPPTCSNGEDIVTSATTGAGAVSSPPPILVSSPGRKGSGGGLDTVDANRALGLPDDTREYGGVVDVLVDLGVLTREGALGPAAAGITLFSNNPRKREQLAGLGVPVAGTIACHVPPPSPLAAAYMRTKAERMGHAIPATVYATAAPLATKPSSPAGSPVAAEPV